MTGSREYRRGPGWLALLFLPLGMWVLVRAGLLGGNLRGVLHPGYNLDFVHALRATLPFLAAFIATLLVLGKVSMHRSPGFHLFSPLALAGLYGVAGVVASLLSPDGSVSLFWSAAYLSVPLVLWGIAWGADPVEQVRRVINFNWFLIVLGVVALFALALIYLDLWHWISDPSRWLDCRSRDSGTGSPSEHPFSQPMASLPAASFETLGSEGTRPSRGY